MNYENVVKSFFLGAVIGMLLQVVSPVPTAGWPLVVGILTSGAVGLLIGLATEWLTSLLPLRLARTAMYFAVNNLIAVVITAIAMVLLLVFADQETAARWNWWALIGAVVSIVSVANLVDFLLYRQSQRQLRALQDAVARTQDDGREEIRD